MVVHIRSPLTYKFPYWIDIFSSTFVFQHRTRFLYSSGTSWYVRSEPVRSVKAIRTHSRRRVLPLLEWMNFNEFLLAPQQREPEDLCTAARESLLSFSLRRRPLWAISPSRALPPGRSWTIDELLLNTFSYCV